MTDVPRRRALLAAAAGLAALTGCAGRETATNSYPSSERPVDDHEVESVRDEGGRALVTAADELPSLSADERALQHRSTRRVLVAEDDLAALTFAETPPGETLRSFCAETEFDAESVYLLAMPIEACRAVRFRSVRVERRPLAEGDLQPHAAFCRAYRPADVDCELDATHTVGFAIRMPVAADRSRGSGRRMSGSCGPGAPPAAFNASDALDASAASGGEDA